MVEGRRPGSSPGMAELEERPGQIQQHDHERDLVGLASKILITQLIETLRTFRLSCTCPRREESTNCRRAVDTTAGTARAGGR